MSAQTTNSHTSCDWDDEHSGPERPCIECQAPVTYGESKCPAGHLQAVRAGGALAGPDDTAFQGYGSGGGGAKRSSEPSEAQIRFLKNLYTQLGFDSPEALIKTLSESPKWNKRGVSELIETAKADVEKARRERQAASPGPTARRNRFGGKCRKCGGWVEAEAGLLTGAPGRWTTEHEGECPVQAPKAAAAPKAEVPEGIHRTEDGTIYKVQVAVHGSGNLYAKRLVISGEGNGSFEYAPGAIKKLSADTLLSLEEAKKFGQLYGICCNCGVVLTDEKSIAAGIGPVCSKRFEF